MEENADDVCTVFGIIYDQLMHEHEEVDGSDIVDLSKQHQTKLSLYSENALRMRPKEVPLMDMSSVYITDSHGKRVGHFTEGWLEGKNVIAVGEVRDKDAAHKIRSGKYKYFSSGWKKDVSATGRTSNGKLYEAAVCETPVFKGCEILCFASENASTVATRSRETKEGKKKKKKITHNPFLSMDKIKKQSYNTTMTLDLHVHNSKSMESTDKGSDPGSTVQTSNTMETEKTDDTASSSSVPGSLLKKLAAAGSKKTSSEEKTPEPQEEEKKAEDDKSEAMTKKRLAQMLKKQQEEIDRLKKEKSDKDEEAEKYRNKYKGFKDQIRQEKKPETDQLLSFSAHFLGVDLKDLDPNFVATSAALMSDPKHKQWGQVLTGFVRELDHATKALSESESMIQQLEKENESLKSRIHGGSGGTAAASATNLSNKRKEVGSFENIFNKSHVQKKQRTTERPAVPPVMQTSRSVSSEFTGGGGGGGGYKVMSGQTATMTASESAPVMTAHPLDAVKNVTWTANGENPFWDKSVYDYIKKQQKRM